jgi:hypothetical protein
MGYVMHQNYASKAEFRQALSFRAAEISQAE